MEVITLFPKTIAKFNLPRELTPDEYAAIELCSKNVKTNDSNYTSANSQVLEISEFKNLKYFILDSVKEYLDKIVCSNNKIEPYITLSWLNFTEKNGKHHKHVHSNSYLSGVFYINAKKEHDTIWFFKSGYERILVYPSIPNIYNAESWYLPVETGELILFPSDMMHSVPTFDQDYTRISLAFNIFMKGVLGNEEELNSITI